ncbi:MAG: hypothetical protein U1F71_22630 [Verrucomicrobiaceae bacterium]
MNNFGTGNSVNNVLQPAGHRQRAEKQAKRFHERGVLSPTHTPPGSITPPAVIVKQAASLWNSA